jgi:succinate dehydrogenase flavin-adding protein (antitoxin of CptAB toxin-antitoxin module)
MLELDVLLNQFLNSRWNELDIKSKHEFECLLTYSDQQLQQWLCVGREADEKVSNITRIIRGADSHKT